MRIVNGRREWFWPEGQEYALIHPSLWNQEAFQRENPFRLEVVGEAPDGMLVIRRLGGAVSVMR
jgi:hypothetical protein